MALLACSHADAATGPRRLSSSANAATPLEPAAQQILHLLIREVQDEERRAQDPGGGVVPHAGRRLEVDWEGWVFR